ncbi:immunity protein WapI [Bacillus subtilis]|uniref:immunity protein WapI n=1 Tax=Bacillus subtilis TaxID=1423 RepID=UPI000B796BEC|nr:immunity protein WapI [Bacillus subtilis]
MAKIKDDCIELELTPRRYQELDDDPFILSVFELLENKKAVVRDFSAVLLESEYKVLISGIETMIKGNQDSISLETIEPFLFLSIDQENGNYRIKIKIIFDDYKESKSNSNLFEINCNEEKLESFVIALKLNLENTKNPSKLP